MHIARDSGRILKTYTASAACPWCKMSKLRYILEFHVLFLENEQSIESTQTIKDVCTHCLTLCDDLPQMDFLCAKCGQLTIFSGERGDEDWLMFIRVIGDGAKFEEFYRRLLKDGAMVGKRYCLICLERLWRDYKEKPEMLQWEIDTPKTQFK